MKQLFKKVHATKPAASRNESAEIFVVCQGYLAPSKIDPKFFDIKTALAQVESDQKQIQFKDFEGGKKRKAVGYEDGATMLYKEKTDLEFFECEGPPLEFIYNINKILLDPGNESYELRSMGRGDSVISAFRVRPISSGRGCRNHGISPSFGQGVKGVPIKMVHNRTNFIF